MSPFTVDQLPVKWIQKIVELLPRKDQLALSMVSKYFRAVTLPVFHTINITGIKVTKVGEVPKWLMDNYVHSILYRVDRTFSQFGKYDHRTFLTQDLNKFKQLTSLHLALELQCLDFKSIQHLRHVRDLTLERCRVTSGGLATLVGSPDLIHLTLINIHSKPHPGEEPSPSSAPSPRPSPRKLSIAQFSCGGFDLLDVIFSVSWDRLSILSGDIVQKLTAIHFIDHANSNLECLELQENPIYGSTYRDCPAIPIPWEC